MKWFWTILVFVIPICIFSNKINEKINSKKTGIIFLSIGIIMIILAVGFVFYAINSPQASYPWSNSITYVIYLSYIIVDIITYILAWKYIKNRKE